MITLFYVFLHWLYDTPIKDLDKLSLIAIFDFFLVVIAIFVWSFLYFYCGV